MLVEIWSDIVCPWCYLGERRFLRALADFPERDRVRVQFRSFQLDPSAESDRPGVAAPAHAERLAAKFGTDTAQVAAMHAQMTALGAEVGIDYRFDDVRSANTFDAHRLLHLAAERGVGNETVERFFRAVFTDGEPMGDAGTLQRVAVDAGLPPDEVADVLNSDRFAADVRADIDRGRELGITGVPFYVLDGRYGVSGAQSVEYLSAALQQAWAATARA